MTIGHRRAATLGLWAALVAGCGDRPNTSFLKPPSPASARAALVAALEDWRVGRRAGNALIGSKPGVGVVDSQRAGRALLGYEVLGPMAVAEAARPFAVRLDLGGPAERVEARYLVFGDDPLWVFRREDYDLILHWEHKMTDDEGAPRDGDR